MRKLLNIGLIVAVALVMTSLLWAQAQGAGQARGQAAPAAGAQAGRGTPYRGKSMPANTPGATYTVIRGGDLQTIANQAGGDTAIRVVQSPAGNYGAYVLTYQPTAPQPGA